MKTISLCNTDDIEEGGAKGLQSENHRFFAVKQNGQIYLYENRCPHKGVPLEWMPDTFLDFEKQYIQCATHGALFTIDAGLCIAGPCNGARLRAIDFQIIDGEICISADLIA